MTMKSPYIYNQLFVRCLYQFVIFSCALTEEINRRCIYIQQREHCQLLIILSGAILVHFLLCSLY